MLRPLRLEPVDPLVHRLESSLLRGRDFVVRDDHEVDVAVLVRVADRERALQIRAAEVVAEHLTGASNELSQHLVQLWKDRGAQARLAERLLEPRVVADGGEIVVPSRLLAERLVQLDRPPEAAERLVVDLAR